MTSVTINKRSEAKMDERVYNIEATDGYTLETPFGVIYGVWLCAEESTVDGTQFASYTTSAGVITINCGGTGGSGTYAVLVKGTL